MGGLGNWLTYLRTRHEHEILQHCDFPVIWFNLRSSNYDH